MRSGVGRCARTGFRYLAANLVGLGADILRGCLAVAGFRTVCANLPLAVTPVAGYGIRIFLPL